MESSLRTLSLTTLFLVAHLLPFTSASLNSPLMSFDNRPRLTVSYHNGPLLTGNVSLALLWYGQFTPVEKNVIRAFIESLGVDRSSTFQPDVYTWWQKVESYVAAAKKDDGEVNVRISREVDDDNASVGNDLNGDLLNGLVQKATAGLANAVAVVFAAKDVTVLDTCNGMCYMHGVQGKQVYMVVGNPEATCPGACGGPFHSSTIGGPPVAVTLEPPSQNMGADAMVIHLASALAETVTNPFDTGYFGGNGDGDRYEVARTCKGLYARGAFPGYPGNLRVDPNTGGAFNAHGLNNSKFLLPALWDVETGCWAIL